PGIWGSASARALGVTLAREAWAAQKDARRDDAEALLELALLAAPADVTVHLTRLRVRLAQGAIGGAALAIPDVLAAAKADPALLASWSQRSSFVLGVWVLGLLVLLAALAALPALRLLGFDLLVTLPRGTSPLVGPLLAGLLAA